ncbi:DNA-invertase hin [Symmachiella dynata]|uniref:DNA-invertase hin n=1 Tax=Symmachiella dynata TaxID=2527995 RepID=A0A517ZPZ2_9PLAN|nr:recombinase family protein [Symmachiella dynata]QDU44510.1 DNA-invertase hin [Symmachiella dynata]
MKNSERNGTIRCAIYSRKSTEEGLDQDFNSLDAQRESAEALIASQKGEGWECLPTRYDDGGFTGGNVERPALRRLMDDIENGQVDCVVVYKVDRLSRSLLDFSRIMETFDKHGVSFVSVTQQFNTTSSMGRLTLNILLSFAQFEREIIGERTRDKMAAARRKGKYVGGAPILGYDIDRSVSRLVVNHREAARVRTIFESYLEQQSLLATIAELDRHQWSTKQWTTKKGKQRGGRAFNKNTLHSLLTNVAYIGKVRYKDEIYEGEHEGIIDTEVFEQVQRLLRLNHRTGGKHVRNQFGSLLKGLVHCVPCGCRMIPSHTTKGGKKRYRYYVCGNAQKRGWDNCPSKSIPAGEIERFVIDQVRQVANEPDLIAATLDQLREQVQASLDKLETERTGIEQDLKNANAEMRSLVTAPDNSRSTDRQVDLLDRMRTAEQRLTEIRVESDRLRREAVTERDVADSLQQFEAVWEALSLREQARVLELLIERVDYDGDAGTVSVTFRPTGFNAVAEELEFEEVAV